MLPSSLFLFGSALASLANALPLFEVRAALPYSIAPATVLTRTLATTQKSSELLHSFLIGQAVLGSELAGQAFYTNITFGTQDFLVIVDTGSSDTWLAETGFTCVNYTNNATISEAACGFASTFTPDASFQQIPNENFNITYGDMEYLNGIVGYETVTLAGIQVPHQEVALATLAGWSGDNITSGLCGLAYPSLTSAFAGTNAKADNFTDPASHLPYSPIINTIFFVENLTDPVFSLALSRNPAVEGFGGYFTIGGIPDITDPTVNASSNFAETAILPYRFQRQAPQLAFYAINISGLVYGRYAPGSGEGASTYIVDSGTTLNYFPTRDAAQFNALYKPPAVLDQGLYFVACNATAPSLGVTISGQTFYHNPSDLIFDAGIGDNVCISGVQDGGGLDGGVLILGDPFLKNVLAVFDVGKQMIAFSSREYYDVPA